MYKLYLVSPENNKTTVVKFASKEIKDNYIRHELEFTRAELKNLWRAVTIDERNKAKLDLYNKRMAFMRLYKNETGNRYA